MKKVLIILLLLFISGCAVNRASLNQFTDESFNSGLIHKLAIFPIRNVKIVPSEAQQLNRKISMAIHEKNPNIEILGPSESVDILNDNDLADAWGNFLDYYISSGIPNRNTLQEIGSALKVDAILQAEIVNVFQADGSYGGNKGTTRVTVRLSMLGTKKGKLLWEASSEGVKGTATTLEGAPPLMDAIDLAVDKLLLNIPL